MRFGVTATKNKQIELVVMLKKILFIIFDFLAPRFVEEDVAVNVELLNDGKDVLIVDVYPLALVEPPIRFDGVVRVRYFNLFGFALFTKPISKLKPFSYQTSSNLQ